MRLGGWWRLWIGISALWIVAVIGVLLPTRPTADSVDRDVGLACDIETPMKEEYARNALQMRSLLDALVVADQEKNEAEAKRLAQEIVRLRELWSKNTGSPMKFSRFTVVDPQGGEHTAIAPLPASNEEVLAQVDADRRDANNWAHFSTYCTDQLKRHATGGLLRARSEEWNRNILLGTTAFPAVLLLLGALIGWIWRGFRPSPDAKG